MTCDEAKDRWQRRLDEGGSDAVLDAHLEQCSECRAYAAQMRAVVEALDVLRETTEEIAAAPAPARVRKMLRIRPWLATAAAIALAVVAYRSTVVRNPQSKQTPPSVADGAAVAEPPVLGLSLQGKSKTQLLAVVMVTTEPNVQVYRLYPRLVASNAEPSDGKN